MKVLTIFFLFASLIGLNPNLWFEKLTLNFYKELREDIAKKDTLEGIDNNYYYKFNTFKVMITYILIIFIPAILETFYICYAIAYDPLKYVALGYLIYTILILVTKTILNRNKFTYTDIIKYSHKEAVNQLDKSICKLLKFSITTLMDKLLSILYYGYMFYIFFVR